ncbi:MAG: hypothetical protein LUH46_06985 [Alistipes sp.]|nr:hypothetical protein [Alistipes sp.]
MNVLLFELLVFLFPRPGFVVAVSDSEHEKQHPDQQPHRPFERPDSRPNSFGSLFRHHVSDWDRKRFLGFCRAIEFRGNNDDPVFLRETILHLLRIYYWDFYVLFQKKIEQ